MNTFLNLLGLAVLVVRATWLVRWIASAVRGPSGERAPPEQVRFDRVLAGDFDLF
jgi:hypothetical protein